MLDVSKGGAGLAKPGLDVGTSLTLTFHRLHPVAAKIVREAEDSLGLSFEPQN